MLKQRNNKILKGKDQDSCASEWYKNIVLCTRMQVIKIYIHKEWCAKKYKMRNIANFFTIEYMNCILHNRKCSKIKQVNKTEVVRAMP